MSSSRTVVTSRPGSAMRTCASLTSRVGEIAEDRVLARAGLLARRAEDGDAGEPEPVLLLGGTSPAPRAGLGEQPLAVDHAGDVLGVAERRSTRGS